MLFSLSSPLGILDCFSSPLSVVDCSYVKVTLTPCLLCSLFSSILSNDFEKDALLLVSNCFQSVYQSQRDAVTIFTSKLPSASFLDWCGVIKTADQ